MHLKLNVDGAVIADQQSMGMGCALRDENGEVLMAAMIPKQNHNSPLEIDLVAILRGLQRCLPMGKRNVMVESDSLLAV